MADVVPRVITRSVGVADARTRGVVFIHGAPRALCPHIEWALAADLGTRVLLDWTPQPVVGGQVRAEFSWTGAPGTAARVVSSLRTWGQLRLEVTEEPSLGAEGERYALTPSLGVFRATIGVHGDVLVNEERLRGALARAAAGDSDLTSELSGLLGTPWDIELEPFRFAGDATSVRWLHQVVS